MCCRSKRRTEKARAEASADASSTKAISTISPPPTPSPTIYTPTSSTLSPDQDLLPALLPDPQPSPFASLTFNQTDRIRLIAFPASIHSPVHTAITTAWPGGVTATRTYAGAHEFKLKGHPWHAVLDHDAIAVRRLVTAVLEALFNEGWIVSFSTNLGRLVVQKDSLVLRVQNPAPPPREWMSVFFGPVDRVRVVDAPRGVVDGVLEGLRGKGFLSECSIGGKEQGVWDFKVKGFLFRAHGEDTVRVREVMLLLLGVLERFGFSVYANLCCEPHDDADSWFCHRVKGWEPGLPAYHA